MSNVKFGALRSRKGRNMDALQKRLEDTGQKGHRDPRIWRPVANQDNVSECVIRFLPIPKVDMQAAEDGSLAEEMLTPAAKIISHYFKCPNGWYSENSPATFGDPCPVLEYNREEWNRSEGMSDKMAADAIQNAVRKRKRNMSYYANIYVIRDKNNPENEGQIKLYKYGETVAKILERAVKPKFESDPSFDPFDLWEGADLHLNLEYEKKTINGNEALVPKFDNCRWGTPAPAFGGDEAKMEEVWANEFSIAEFYSPKNFKSYEALKDKFDKAMGLDGGPVRDRVQTNQTKLDTSGSTPEPAAQSGTAPEPTERTAPEKPATTVQAAAPEQKEPEQKAAPAADPTPATAVASEMDDFEAMLADM